MEPATLIVQNSKVSGNVVKYRSETGSAVGGGIFVEGDFAAGSTESTITRLADHGQPSASSRGTGAERGRDLRPRSDHHHAIRDLRQQGARRRRRDPHRRTSRQATVIDTTISGNRPRPRGRRQRLDRGSGLVHQHHDQREQADEGPGLGGGALYTRSPTSTMEHVTVAENHSGKKRAIVLDPVAAGAIDLDMIGSAIAGPHKDCKGFDRPDSDVSARSTCSATPPAHRPESRRTWSRTRAEAARRQSRRVPGLNFYGPTHMPKNGSPVVGFVTSGCPPPAQDQLGLDRIGPCDAGAVERPGV